MCRAARLGVLEFLEHDHPGAFAEDEAVAVEVERPARCGRAVVALREGREQVEAGDAERVDHAVRAAGEHHVGVAAADHLGRLADGLRAGGTGGQARANSGRPARTSRRGARRGCASLLRLPAARPALRKVRTNRPEFAGRSPGAVAVAMLLTSTSKSSVPSPEPRYTPMRERSPFTSEQPGVRERLLGGAERELRVHAASAEAARVLDELGEVEARHLRGERGGERAGVEVRRSARRRCAPRSGWRTARSPYAPAG